MRRHLFAAALFVGIGTAASVAAARGEDTTEKPAADQSTGKAASDAAPKDGATKADQAANPAAAEEPEKDEPKSPWRGSIMLFDQSVTTTTVGLGRDYNGANPLYEWWVAFKPRYTVFQTKRDTLSINLWMNLYLELTNSDSTTTAHEPVIGPSYLSASYAHTLFQNKEWKTTFSLGPRLGIPTDMAARNRGQLLGLGASSGLSQSFPLAGKGASFLNSGNLGVSVIANHPFTRATTAVKGDLGQLRQDINGSRTPTVDSGKQHFQDLGVGPGQSDQLGGGMGVQNSVNVSFSGGLQITPKLSLGLSYVILNSWAYRPKDVVVCTTLGNNCVEPERVSNPTNYRVSTWALASIDYDAMDEMSIGVGYYNLNEQLGSDGLRRNPLWSPEARLFLTATGNLDAIYRRLVSKSPSTQTATR